MKVHEHDTTHRSACRRWLVSGLMACLLTVSASAAVRAQDADDENVHTIEVRDGKVWVDGEAVTELDDDGRRIIFRHGDDSDVIAFGDDDIHRAFAFDNFDRHRLFSDRDADFEVRSGNFAEYFADDSDHRPFVFEFGNDPLSGALGDGLPSAEVMKLEQEARRLAERIRREDGESGELEDELDNVLSNIFDLKMASRAERVEHLESRLQDLRDRIEQRESDRELIIEQRKQELLGRHDRYKW